MFKHTVQIICSINEHLLRNCHLTDCVAAVSEDTDMKKVILVSLQPENKLFIIFFNFQLYIGVYMIYNVILISGVSQIDLYIYMYLFFFKFLSHIGYQSLLNRVPCAIQQVLVDYTFYIEYMLIPIFQLISITFPLQ